MGRSYNGPSCVKRYKSTFSLTCSLKTFVLPITSVDLVLGVQWLKSLCPIFTDFDKLIMRFKREGQVVQFQGIPRPKAHEISFQNLK